MLHVEFALVVHVLAGYFYKINTVRQAGSIHIPCIPRTGVDAGCPHHFTSRIGDDTGKCLRPIQFPETDVQVIMGRTWKDRDRRPGIFPEVHHEYPAIGGPCIPVHHFQPVKIRSPCWRFIFKEISCAGRRRTGCSYGSHRAKVRSIQAAFNNKMRNVSFRSRYELQQYGCSLFFRDK